ncbi:MAG TPA: DUF1059 domain-containing protein [Candidatus Sulfobium mesophilum]|nr:DUF1059 domain-containing protein [Candidatus Sulfobium mesophilum]
MKTLVCRDVGVDCDHQVRGRTVDEVLRKATAHAKKNHHIKKVSKEYLESWRMKIHDV